MNLLQSLFLMPLATVFAESTCKQFCNVPSKWIPQARGVCHGVTNDDFGSFKIKQDCMLVAFRLTHVSGYLTGSKNQPKTFSRWGTLRDSDGSKVNTIILKGSKLFSPETVSVKGFHTLNGFGAQDDVLVFKKRANLTAGEEFQIAFGRDFKDHQEQNNGGYHCVDIDISCLV